MTESNSPKNNTILAATSILDLLSEKIVGQQTAIAGIASTVGRGRNDGRPFSIFTRPSFEIRQPNFKLTQYPFFLTYPRGDD